MYLLILTGISITHIIKTRQYKTAVNSFYLMYGYIFEIYFPHKTLHQKFDIYTQLITRLVYFILRNNRSRLRILQGF